MTIRFDPGLAAEPGTNVIPDPQVQPLRPPGVGAEEFRLLSEVLTLYHAKRALRRIGEANGFSAFALLGFKAGCSHLVPDMITANWPTDPSETLRTLAEQRPDVRTRLADDVLPFLLGAEDARRLSAPGGGAILCLPLFCDRGRGVLLCASEGPWGDGAHAELHLYALYLFARLSAQSRPRAPAATLAPREIECLRWSAAGKTSCEIAGILGVSENTVNSYLSAAAQKMNAVNRVQTVAQAIRLGLLA